MQLPALHSMLHQASELAAVKNASLEAVCRREEDAERVLAEVRAEKAVRAGSAQSANELVTALQEKIQRHTAGTGPKTVTDVAEEPDNADPPSTRASIHRATRELLLEQGEATTKEIRQHIENVLPHVNVKSTSPELTHLVQQGLLVRPRSGVYQLGGEWATPESR
ncbi:hypothetical protein [Streptomyces sp. WAC04114]|uniref:hypothetical protein n=1 Tax=Streptomyces sp. WAC04114 TaxID=2867961 RepID=UPI001C8C64E4|nr:hypothetical protein [Streptomyces sp. WAC04114]MBX9363645.1 hypothetical protein [Streptomyces sp. WAC04114]